MYNLTMEELKVIYNRQLTYLSEMRKLIEQKPENIYAKDAVEYMPYVLQDTKQIIKMARVGLGYKISNTSIQFLFKPCDELIRIKKAEMQDFETELMSFGKQI